MTVPVLDLCIRHATPTDAPAVIAAINAVCAEGVYLLTTGYVPTPQWEAVLHHPEQTPDCLLLVPEVDEQVIGWCRIFPGAVSKMQHAGDVGIGLLAPFREQGLGTTLMQEAITWARQQGLGKLTADTFSNNVRALALFSKMGFEITGVRHRQYRLNDLYSDQVLLERFL